MKKNIKLFVCALIGFILGVGITVTASVIYNSSEIGFTPSDSNWKVNNLQDAINDLYSKGLSGDIELKYGSFQQLGNYSTTTKQYSFTTETAGRIIVVMQATGSNSGVTGRTTRYVKVNGESMPLTNVVADSWQFGTYYIGEVPANATIQSYISNAASGSLNTAGLFVFFEHN